MESDSSPTGHDKHPLDVALDLLVYAPVGFALEARELVPRLAERGRGQVTLARLLGRFALQKSQQEADRLLTRARPRSTPAAPSPAAPDPDTAAASPPPPPDVAPSVATTAVVTKPKAARTAPAVRAPGRRPIIAASAKDAPKPVSAKVSVTRVSPTRAANPKPAAKANPKPAAKTATKPAATRKGPARAVARSTASAAEITADRLPIPSYDTLSASQVVPRLDSLRPAELEQVRIYEAAHRGRRTILSRVAQLQS
jgi:hypothetical protein